MLPASLGIYGCFCSVTGMVYVGSAKNMAGRVKKHTSDLQKTRHHCEYLQHAWNKYGPENFEWRVIETCASEEQLRYLEQFWHDHYRDHTGIYNLASASRGRAPSAYMSALHKQRWQDPLERQKYLDGSRAYWESEEARDMRAHGLANMARPGIREKIAATLREYFKGPQARWAAGRGIRAYFTNPENIKKRGHQSEEMWANPEIRARILASIALTNQKPETKKNRSEAAKKRSANPEFISKMSATRKAQSQDPVYKANHLAAAQRPERNKAIGAKARARWAQPGFKERVGPAISAGRKRAAEAKRLAKRDSHDKD